MQDANKSKNLIALLISVPVTSFGAMMSLWIVPGAIGQTILVLCQIWLFFLPIIWLLKIESKSITISKPQGFDVITGLIIGLLMFVIILTVYWLFLRHWIDNDIVRLKVQAILNINQRTFVFGAAYFSLVNALIEEYFWRWFIFSRCEELVSSKVAVVITSLFFTLHHTIGLAAFTNWQITITGSLAVFPAGLVWSEYYRRYRSIWSNYFSHAIADIALHIVAWQVFFS